MAGQETTRRDTCVEPCNHLSVTDCVAGVAGVAGFRRLHVVYAERYQPEGGYAESFDELAFLTDEETDQIEKTLRALPKIGNFYVQLAMPDEYYQGYLDVMDGIKEKLLYD